MARYIITHNNKIPLISESYNKIADGLFKGLLVAVHSEISAQLPNSAASYICYSTDGVTWTASNTGIIPTTEGGGQAGDRAPRQIAYDSINERFVIACSGPTTQARPQVMYSDDLFNWSTASTAYSNGQENIDIAFSPSLQLFVIVGENKPQYSSNGVNWTLSSSSVSTLWRRVRWVEDKSKFFAANFLGSNFAYSTNGTTWTQATSSQIWDFAYSTESDRIVAINPSFSRFSYSNDDGLTWTTITQSYSTFSNVSWRSIDYSPDLDLFLAAGISTGTAPWKNNIFATSKTGLTWSEVVAANVYDEWGQSCWSDEFKKFALFPSISNYSGSSIFAWTEDGVNFGTQSCDFGVALNGSTTRPISIKNILV